MSAAAAAVAAAAENFPETLEFHGDFYEVEFHNSIQDWVFATVYQLQKGAWKNTCLAFNIEIQISCNLWTKPLNQLSLIIWTVYLCFIPRFGCIYFFCHG